MLAKKLSHVPTLASLNIRYKKTFGHKFRDVIAACGSYLKPVRKYIFPNFLAVHYCYIIFVTIIASILMYPVRNQKYIDILFLAAGATTQGGLNTVDTNTLSLYQQIIVYITCVFCTPIVIHGCLAFVRLYWFERYFDGIRDSSKKNYKMRRTKTILGREMTSRTMSKMPQRPTHTLSMLPTSSRNDENFQDKLFSGKEFFRKEGEDDVDNDKPDTTKPKDKNGFDSNGSSWSSSNTVKENGNPNTHVRGDLVFKEPGIKKPTKPRERFAGRRSSADISPEDMYRSIQMMQGQHQEAREDEGPALVIGAPTDRPVTRNEEAKQKQAPEDGTKDDHHSILTENQSKHTSALNSSIDPHHTQTPPVQKVQSSPIASLKTIDEETKMGRKDYDEPEANKPTIQFDVSAQPKRPSSKIVKDSTIRIPRRGNQYRTKSNRGLLKHLPKGKELRQKLKRRLSSNSADGLNSEKRRSYTDDDEPTDKDNMEEYFADNESDEDDEEHPNVYGEGKRLSKVPTTGEVEEPRRSQLAEMPRSLTMDARQAKDLNQLAQTPEFQKMIYKDWKKKHRKPNPLRRKSWNAKKFENEYSAGFPWMQEAFNADENLSSDHDSGEVNSGHGSSFDNVKGNVASDSDDAANQEPSSPRDRDSLDEEQGYYGLTIDPEFTSNARPAIARTMSTNYLSWEPTIGRNSAFTGLSKAQREELGGIEYTSIKLLCRILVIYYAGFLILSFVLIVPWVLHQSHYKAIIRENGVSPTWWGFFTAMSAFTDLGITVTRDSMLSFNKAVYPLVVMMWFIIVGNTGFPVLLRFIIWVLFKLSPELSQFKENLGFLLDHPRRCFTLLFPSAATWWLLATLVALNGIDLVLFIILDFGSAVLRPLARGFRVLDGLFQAVSTRTAGFTVVDLSKLHPAIQVSYMLMMYVSVLPLAISIRRTNVYEEQSLGLYGEMTTEDTSSTDYSTDSEGSSDSGSRRKKKKKKQGKDSNESFIGAHLRRQLSFDIWFLFLGLFIICLCEGGKIQDTSKPEFNVFAVLFEIVSAYGTVGLSLGFPNTNTSFSGQFTTLSKLVIIAMLIRGRHRGLPYALDRAIMLPSDRLEHIDHIEDLKLKRTTRNSTNNVDPVTAYFKKRTGKLHRGFDRLRRSVAEPEEAHLEAYGQHNNSPDYNLPGEDERDYQLETVSQATHSAPSSVHSPGSIDSEQLTDRDSNHDSMHLTHPISYS